MEQNLSLRIGGTLVLGLTGFVFPLAWIGAILLLLSVINAVASEQETPRKGHGRVQEVTEASQGWRARFHACCESPAETAFLDAMIAEFQLKPDAGRLVGQGMVLHLQVPVLDYRLDFLVEPGLVVEIDGAAFHSSPEAVARDRSRDQRLAELGYHTLRIPARVVLYAPGEATSRVKEAWAERQAAAHRAQMDRAAHIRGSFRPKQVIGALGQALTSLQKGISDGADYVHRRSVELAEQDRLAVERKRQDELAQVKAELDADPELQVIHDQLIKELG